MKYLAIILNILGIFLVFMAGVGVGVDRYTRHKHARWIMGFLIFGLLLCVVAAHIFYFAHA